MAGLRQLRHTALQHVVHALADGRVHHLRPHSQLAFSTLNPGPLSVPTHDADIPMLTLDAWAAAQCAPCPVSAAGCSGACAQSPAWAVLVRHALQTLSHQSNAD